MNLVFKFIVVAHFLEFQLFIKEDAKPNMLYNKSKIH